MGTRVAKARALQQFGHRPYTRGRQVRSPFCVGRADRGRRRPSPANQRESPARCSLPPPNIQGGAATGPNPTDRGKPGTQRHLVVDRRGIPLAVMLTGANQHESTVFEAVLDHIPPITRPRGRPRTRPDKLHADKAYDMPRCRRALRRRHIKVRIARKGVESSERLGRYRWVVERTLAWLAKYRRLTIRYERRADIHEAFLPLGCALIGAAHR